MGIAEAYPAPVHGVSTLAPRNRLEGQAGLQENFRSDPVRKLNRRPSMKWVYQADIISGTRDDLTNHVYVRDGKEHRLILNSAYKQLLVLIDNVQVDVVAVPDYSGPNMIMQTIEDTTYFLNPEVPVVLKDDIDDELSATKRTVSRVAHINVTSALNYGERVTVRINNLLGNLLGIVAYAVPDVTGTNYSIADKARATKAVAEGLAEEINKLTNGLRATSTGSTVAVYKVNTNDPNNGQLDYLHIEVEAGQGSKSVVAINGTVETIEGLPKYAVVGTRIKIRPNPTSDKGTYYLNATSVATGKSEWNYISSPLEVEQEEVVWAESRKPDEPYSLDSDTLPYTYTLDDGIQTIAFKDRRTGDNTSVRVPDFVGKTITNIAYFQKRLVFLSENNAVMSETDEPSNFWRQSAVQLLVTDAVSVASSVAGADKLLYATPHNRDLLITTTNSQFKIDGSVAVTPQTVAMPLTTSYESQAGIAPVSMGNSIILPISYGESSGVQAYSGERDTQDVAQSLTDHVIGYMAGDITILASNPNLEMLAVATSAGGNNRLFIYEQFTNNGKRLQQSWSTWLLPEDTDVVDVNFSGDKLTLLVIETGKVVIKEISLYSKVATGGEEVYLDDMLSLPTDGTTAELPHGYNAANIVVVRGEGTNYEFNLAKFYTAGQTIHFEDNIGVGTVYVGRRFRSRYIPTRPYKYDENGIVDTLDRLRVNKYKLSVVDTNRISMAILSDYYDGVDQTFTGRVAGQLGSKLGEVPFHTGDVKFAYSQQADQANAEFYCDNHLGCTIAGISWEGQHHKTRNGIR